MSGFVFDTEKDFAICGSKSFDEIKALKEERGLQGILYLTPDDEEDTTMTPNGYEGAKELFGENCRRIACIPSDFECVVSFLVFALHCTKL